MPIRWISFEDAKRKPVVSIGSFRWPNTYLPLASDHDGRIVAGYIVVTTRDLVTLGEDSMFSQIATVNDGDRAIVPLAYATTPERPKQSLRVGTSTVTVRAPFKPDSLPARYKPIEVKVGPHSFTTAFHSTNGTHAVILVSGPTVSPGGKALIVDFPNTSWWSMNRGYSYVVVKVDQQGVIQFTVSVKGEGLTHLGDARLAPRK
jgi:hypothetical protein